jgi:hypothetical protein
LEAYKRTYGVHLREVELETVDLIFVKRILVEYLDVDEPVAGNAVVTLYQCDAGGHAIFVNLRGRASSVQSMICRRRAVRLTLPNSLTRRLSRVAPAMIDAVSFLSEFSK